MIDTNELRRAAKCVYLAVDAKSAADDLSAMLRGAADELDAARKERDALLLAVRRVLIRWHAGDAVGDALMDLDETVGTSDRLAATADAARRKDEAFAAMREALNHAIGHCNHCGFKCGGCAMCGPMRAALAMADAAAKPVNDPARAT